MTIHYHVTPECLVMAGILLALLYSRLTAIMVVKAVGERMMRGYWSCLPGMNWEFLTFQTGKWKNPMQLLP